MLTAEMEQMLLSFDDPDLTQSQREQLGQLLETSPEAREYLRQLQSLDLRLENLTVDLDSMDLSGFAQAVNQKIDAAPISRRLPWRWLAPLSAAAAIVMVVLPWLNPPSPTPPQTVAKVVLTQPLTIASTPVAKVALSYVPPTLAKASIVKVTLASEQMAIDQNVRQGEVICFAGPVLHRQSIKPNRTPNNNYYVF
jgi:hypothetical protein